MYLSSLATSYAPFTKPKSKIVHALHHPLDLTRLSEARGPSLSFRMEKAAQEMVFSNILKYQSVSYGLFGVFVPILYPRFKIVNRKCVC